MPLRAVFLDVGETIMRPDPSWEGIYAIALDEFGIPVGMDELSAALRRAYQRGGYGFEGGFTPSPEESHRRAMAMDEVAFAELGIGPMPAGFYERLGQLFGTAGTWHIYPDTWETLPALRERGLIVGVVSNWVWQLPELLHALDLIHHFDFVAASARVGYDKPHPGIFSYALEQAGVAPGEALHVGDRLDADVAGARAAGLDAVLLDRRGRHQAPDDVTVVRSLTELLPIVDARLG
jgi:putative hydrolase of the HAD superfamily